MNNKNKKSEEVLIGKHPMQVTIGNPKDKAEKCREKKMINKLNSMKIALTYIESQGMTDVNPKKATKIADEFLEWLEK